MALSRRVFLSLIGLIPFLSVRPGRAADDGATAADGGEIVVVRGWVLRRDDLDRLAPR